MRHLYGIALAAALAAAMFFGGGWGYSRVLGKLPAGSSPVVPAGSGSLLGNSAIVLGFSALLGTALLAGLLIVIPRVSPLATGLPGLGLLAWTAFYLVAATRAMHYIPLKSHSFGAGFAALGIDGLLGAAGLVLVMPLFLPSRWRLSPVYDEDDYSDVLEASSVTVPSRAAGLLTSDWRTEPTQFNPAEPPAGW